MGSSNAWKLLVNDADRLQLSVSDDEVTDEIYNGFIHVSVPSDNIGLAYSLNHVFDGKIYAGFRDQKTKHFELKVYERTIKAAMGRSPTEFREEQARELLAAKVRDLVRAPIRGERARRARQLHRREEHRDPQHHRGEAGLRRPLPPAPHRQGSRRLGEGPCEREDHRRRPGGEQSAPREAHSREVRRVRERP